jgi:hypothetical protein
MLDAAFGGKIILFASDVHLIAGGDQMNVACK